MDEPLTFAIVILFAAGTVFWWYPIAYRVKMSDSAAKARTITFACTVRTLVLGCLMEKSDAYQGKENQVVIQSNSTYNTSANIELYVMISEVNWGVPGFV